MPRQPKTIVPVDPEHQPHIKKFVTDGKKVGLTGHSLGNKGNKVANKTILKKTCRRSTGEPKTNPQKRRPPINSCTDIDVVTASLADIMSTTTINPVLTPGSTMLQEIKIWRKDFRPV